VLYFSRQFQQHPHAFQPYKYPSHLTLKPYSTPVAL
jgi:hypothetical protein